MEFDDDQTQLPNEAPRSSLLTVGQQLGQYKVTGLLGRGGMGEVYEVKHAVLHRSYALKVIRPEVLDRPSAMERFQREAQVMNHLEHPHIVQVDEFGESDGLTWLRMPLLGRYVDADSRLLNSLADRLAGGQHLTEAEAIRYLKQILSALEYAHGMGAIHRDIKPSNILFDLEGNLKIADFGLVHMAGEQWVRSQVELTVAHSMAVAEDPDATRLDDGGSAGTSTQALLGTFEFMSPEQKRGEPADERSDLYAVGLIAFRMLTGDEAPGFDLPSEIVPELDPAWDRWIKRAIAAGFDRRWESAATMSASLPSQKPKKMPVSQPKPVITIGRMQDSEPVPVDAAPPVYFNETVKPDSKSEQSEGPIHSDTNHSSSAKKKSNVPSLVWILGLIVSLIVIIILFFGKSTPTRNSAEDTVSSAMLGDADYDGDEPKQGVEKVLKTHSLASGQSNAVAEYSSLDFLSQWKRMDDLVILEMPFIGEKTIQVIPLSVDSINFTYLLMNGRILEISLSAIPEGSLAEIRTWSDMSESIDAAYAQTVLGFAYTGSHGFEENQALARQCFELAAGSGHVGANFILGEMLVYGQGGPTDYTRAMGLFNYAANEGLPDAFTMIGFMFSEGFGVDENQETANDYYQKGYAEGDVEAAWRLGISHFYGLGLDVDREKGLELIREAVGKDSERAQEILKIMEREHGITSGASVGQSPFEMRAALPIQTLTDLQGRTIRATIVKVTESDVKIRRSDGLETTIPLSMLTADDINFCNYLRGGSNQTDVSDLSFDLGHGEKLDLIWIASLNGWVSKYEVTNGQYRRYKNRHDSGEYEGQSLNGKDQPVVHVSYNDAEAYTVWLNGKFRDRLPSAYEFRLPTGSEWLTYEQCGDSRLYPWGNLRPPKYGNYKDLSAVEDLDFPSMNDYRDGHAVSAPVYESGGNEWGLYGVGGNVWEWNSEPSGALLSMGGGSWDLGDVEALLRCESGRLSASPSHRLYDLGFRVVLLR